MIAVLILNLLLVSAAAVTPNEFLRWHSYVFYGVQLCTLLPYAAWRAFFTRNLFLPSLFVLAYFGVSLTLGAWLVPRSYGFNKEYGPVSLAITTYNVIVPYLLLANVVLFVLTCRSLRALAALEVDRTAPATADRRRGFGLGVELACLGAFTAASVFSPFNAFSFQLAFAIVHLSEVARRRVVRRFVVYLAYLAVMVATNYENKREIAMMLFFVAFIETYYSRLRLRLTPASLLGYAALGAGFLGLILTASILRGYGDFDVTSAIDAVLLIPRYIGADIFVDGLTDNLELNYSYGAAITSIHLTLHGDIPYQLGASLWKVLLLPVSRDLFPDKPESVMLLFTRIYSPHMYSIEGSLPVFSSSEMFVNFGPLGLVPFALIWAAVNRSFVHFQRSAPGTPAYYACAFLSVTVLMFARGSGLEQYVLYLLVAAPVFFVAWPLARPGGTSGPAPHPALVPVGADT